VTTCEAKQDSPYRVAVSSTLATFSRVTVINSQTYWLEGCFFLQVSLEAGTSDHRLVVPHMEFLGTQIPG
jgi:hypothetical protein